MNILNIYIYRFVGHVKGIVHYAMGDTEKGHKAMEASTRTTAVLGAGVLTGKLKHGTHSSYQLLKY